MQKPGDYKKAKIKLYHQQICKLMYLLCGTKSNISFAVKQLSKQNANIQINYMKAEKKVVCYLKATMHLGLIYGGHLKDEKKLKHQSHLLYLD